jgi:hypothetical protein
VKVATTNSVDGGALGETDALGDSDGESEGLGLMLGDGETDADGLLDGDTDADGDSDGDTLGEPTDATLRTSTSPARVGEALFSVNDPLLTVVNASNDWSAHTTPCESLRSVHGLGVV